MDATRFLSQQMLIRQEVQWAADAFTTGIWGTDATPSPLWDAASSTPIADVELAKNTVLTNTGYVPNTIIMSYKAFSALVDNADIVDRIKYTSQDSVTEELLARVFGVDRVLVMASVYNSAQEGATASYSQVGDKDVLVCYTPSAPGLMVPSAGYTMNWSGVSAGLGTASAVSRYRMDTLRADRIEIERLGDHYDDQLTQAGFFFPETKAASMRLNMRNMWSRLTLTKGDVRILHGVLRQLTRR